MSRKGAEFPEFGGAFLTDDGEVYITRVLYNNPATIVFWNDNTKTIATAHDGDTYDVTTGVLICVLKKLMGSDFAVKTVEDWCTPNGKLWKTLADVRREHKKKK